MGWVVRKIGGGHEKRDVSESCYGWCCYCVGWGGVALILKSSRNNEVFNVGKEIRGREERCERGRREEMERGSEGVRGGGSSVRSGRQNNGRVQDGFRREGSRHLL